MHESTGEGLSSVKKAIPVYRCAGEVTGTLRDTIVAWSHGFDETIMQENYLRPKRIVLFPATIVYICLYGKQPFLSESGTLRIRSNGSDACVMPPVSLDWITQSCCNCFLLRHHITAGIRAPALHRKQVRHSGKTLHWRLPRYNRHRRRRRLPRCGRWHGIIST